MVSNGVMVNVLSVWRDGRNGELFSARFLAFRVNTPVLTSWDEVFAALDTSIPLHVHVSGYELRAVAEIASGHCADCGDPLSMRDMDQEYPICVFCCVHRAQILLSRANRPLSRVADIAAGRGRYVVTRDGAYWRVLDLYTVALADDIGRPVLYHTYESFTNAPAANRCADSLNANR